ncbi:hypothetical protein PHMEG_0006912 [Phytophthora megakarya]|uniref:Uncharacterized protein n=1 Tax=Phytophthora megakarya TaxID=4795 RepID=A0A225WMN8_9STRA|nr:hypothetical protein PHMEG_0006912 [Phytophthora megakarya]
MDIILAQFSSDELRVKCLTAVYDQLRHAEAQIHPALDALKCALSVVRASKKMNKGPLDESPDVSKALNLLFAGCNEIETLICDLNREVSNAGGTMSPSGVDGMEETQAEPEEEVPVKNMYKDTGTKVEQEGNFFTSVAGQATIVLPLSDEETVVVKDEPMQGEIGIQFGPGDHVAEIVEPSTSRVHGCFFMPDQMNREEKSGEVGPSPRKKVKTMETSMIIAPLPELVTTEHDVVTLLRQRMEVASSGAIGARAAVGFALNVAISIEERGGMTRRSPLIRELAASISRAGQKLMEVREKQLVQVEHHLEDISLLMSVAVVNLEKGLRRDEVREAWKMLKVIKELHDVFPLKTKSLYRYVHSIFCAVGSHTPVVTKRCICCMIGTLFTFPTILLKNMKYQRTL